MKRFNSVEHFIDELPKYLGMAQAHPSCLDYLSDIRVMLSELKTYKDAEEQGLLLRLPIAIGGEFWELNYACKEPYIYPRIAHQLHHCVYVMEHLGKTVFLTREEAEQALEKMKGV